MKKGAPSDGSAPLPWYLLIHKVPPKPLYFRAKIRHSLARSGAVALKKAVYVLPRTGESLKDFQRIADQAIAASGEAYVCEAEFLEGRTDTALVERFRAARNADYEALATALRDWDVPRARKRFDEIAQIDFFDAPARRKTERLLKQMERPRRPRSTPRPDDLVGRTWITRRGLHVDRIASAWLIRRFIDPRAGLRFVDPKEPARAGELRFDMVGGDFSHEGDRCTFETLLARTGVGSRALTEIAEIVHDIDIKDGKFARPEAAGVERLLIGLILANPEDEARLERGLVLFDELYQSFCKTHSVFSKEVSR